MSFSSRFQRKPGGAVGVDRSVCGKTDTEYRDTHLSIEAYDAIMAWLAARPFMSEDIFTSFEGLGNRPMNKALSEAAVWQTVQKYAAKMRPRSREAALLPAFCRDAINGEGYSQGSISIRP